MHLATISPGTTVTLKKLIDDATKPTTSSPVLTAALVHIIDAKNHVLLTLDAASPDVVRRGDAFPQGAYHTGCLGTGLVSSTGDYAHLLSILLPQNAGVDPITGYRVLSAESVREITSPQLPVHLRNDSRSLPVSDAPPVLLPVDLSAPYLDPEGSYGLGCGVQGAGRVLQRGKKGRREGSVYWYGATNCETWLDGASGILVAIWGDYYPWNEKVWMDFVAEVEGIVYET